ncbi:MAG TPA: GNAT family N-acetyltransferase [Candidatus Sulfotelmatobacter sp.]
MPHPAAPRITLLREIPDDSTLREQWNALVLQTHCPQVFYTYEWARAMQLAYGQSLCPLLLLGYDADHLVGVAALAAPSGGPISFLCASTGDYCDFVVSEQNAVAFTSQVFEALRRQGYRDAVMTNVPQDSPCYARLREAARPNSFHMYAREAYQCAQVRLSTMVSPTGELALPRQKMVRRSLRVMGEAGPLAMTHESQWEEVRSLLPEFFRAHVARFLFTSRISNMVRSERRSFLNELARLLSATGWLCLTRLKVGPRTVSWNYGFLFRGTWFLYQPTFVNDLEKYSPGFVLLSKLIEDAAGNPAVETVDLGLGAETYKSSFGNAVRRTMYVTLHRSLPKHWKEIVRYRAARAVAAWPRAEETARNLVAKASRFRFRVRQSGVKSTFAWAWLRMRSWVFSREEILFFESAAGSCGSSQQASQEGFLLQPVTYELVAEVAMQSCEDDLTLQYLLRSARRLRQGEAEGFALVDAAGTPLHFAWATAFDPFFSVEWNASVKASSPDCMVLFDCWTPLVEQGKGHFVSAAGLIADKMRRAGKRLWTFSTAADTATIREIETAGFQRRYSLVRQKVFGVQQVKGQTPLSREKSPAEVSAST